MAERCLITPHALTSFCFNRSLTCLEMTTSQERLFLAIKVPLPENAGDSSSGLAELLKQSAELKSEKKANGWVPLLHITLYFFQHDSNKEEKRVITAEEIIKALSAPEFKVPSFELELSKIVFCGSRTLRLAVEDQSTGLQKLHHAIIAAMSLPEFEGGWEGGHVSLYRFSTSESKAIAKKSTDPSLSWVDQLVEQYSDLQYRFKVTDFVLYRSERSGYVPLATFKLEE